MKNKSMSKSYYKTMNLDKSQSSNFLSRYQSNKSLFDKRSLFKNINPKHEYTEGNNDTTNSQNWSKEPRTSSKKQSILKKLFHSKQKEYKNFDKKKTNLSLYYNTISDKSRGVSGSKEDTKLIENILSHLSKDNSYRSIPKEHSLNNSPPISDEDVNLVIRQRRRKYSYQGEYFSGNRECQDDDKFLSFKRSRMNFRNIMHIRKEMGIYMRKSSASSNINVNSLINYVSNNQIV